LAVLVKSSTRGHGVPSRLAQVTLALCTLLAAPLAAADQFDTINFTLGSNRQYNSNVFRTPDTTGPQPGFSTKSDYSTTTNFGVNIEKAYSLQRFQLGGNYNIRRFDTFSTIDSDTLSYQGAWLWALTPHLTGSLNASRTQTQISFADDEGATQRNIRTTTNQNLTFDAWVSGKWHLIGGLGKSEAITEQALLSSPGTRSQNVEGGVKYVSTASNSITFTHRVRSTELTNFTLNNASLVETDYRDIESEVKVSWQLSGHSSVSGRVARKARRNEHFSQRDFSAYAADISYDRKVSEKLKFTLSASRNPSPFPAIGNTSPSANFKLDQKLSLATTWQPSAKTSVNFTLSRLLSDFQGDVLRLGGAPRSDDLRSAQLGFSWGVRRYVSLNASLARDLRTTNTPGFQYSNNSASVGADLKF
jgi:exopolysaccharide biosynthesis operon protein EpsL